MGRTLARSLEFSCQIFVKLRLGARSPAVTFGARLLGQKRNPINPGNHPIFYSCEELLSAIDMVQIGNDMFLPPASVDESYAL